MGTAADPDPQPTLWTFLSDGAGSGSKVGLNYCMLGLLDAIAGMLVRGLGRLRRLGIGRSSDCEAGLGGGVLEHGWVGDSECW
jgi:hypothetical protein